MPYRDAQAAWTALLAAAQPQGGCIAEPRLTASEPSLPRSARR